MARFTLRELWREIAARRETQRIARPPLRTFINVKLRVGFSKGNKPTDVTPRVEDCDFAVDPFGPRIILGTCSTRERGPRDDKE